MQSSPVLYLSPSFNSYSSGKLAAIAARVIEEFQAESDSNDDDIFNYKHEKPFISDDAQKQPRDEDEEEEEEVNSNKEVEDDEFEFAFVSREPDSSPISADEIFYKGQIRPVFPLFNRNLLLSDAEIMVSNSAKPPVRQPLRKLFSEERDSPSCSSSEADELDGISPGTYCVWTPKAAEVSPERCKKSNSTGNASKRWKFRNLLHRSNSEGKDSFVFLTPSSSKKRMEKVDKVEKASTVTGNVKSKVVKGDGVSAKEAHNTRNGAIGVKEGDQRRSFLPYRQDLVGFFTNVNGLSRNLHPF